MSRRRFLQLGLGATALAGTAMRAGPALAAGGPRALATPHPASSPAGAAQFPFGTMGAELEYYRMDPADVAPRLVRTREACFRTIQTYVPWNVHEATRGVLDFHGRTQPVLVNDHFDRFNSQPPQDQFQTGGVASQVVANTNLAAFLQDCRSLGLAVILRPGPFISDEWRNGGIPDWLLTSGYPGIFMEGPAQTGTGLQPNFPLSPPAAIVTGGQSAYYFAGPSYASSAYLAEVRRWLAQEFAPFVRPWLVTHGGPVVAIQVDDETCYYYQFGPFEVDYHPEMVAGYRRRYGAAPPTAWPSSGGPAESLRPALHWQRFKADVVGGYLGALVGDLQEAGLTGIPYTHELTTNLAPPPGFAQDAQATLLLPEYYFGDSGPWSVPVNELCSAAIRSSQRNRRPVIAAEMQEADVLLYYLIFGEEVLGGLQFEYTSGVPESAFGPLHALARTVAKAGDHFGRARRRTDTAIVWNPEWFYLPYQSDQYGLAQDQRKVVERHLAALATLLMRAGYAFDLLDATVAQPEDYTSYPTVWLVGANVLPHACQVALVDYVQGGGRLVCFPAPPTLGAELGLDTTLARALYPEPVAQLYPEDGQQVEVLGQAVTTWRGVQTYRLGPGSRAVAHRAGQVCGYRRHVGRGQAVLLGTYLAADSVVGWSGNVMEVQQVDATTAGPAAKAMATRAFGSHGAQALAAAQLPPTWPGTGPPRYLVTYDYFNQRQGPEFLPASSLAYWDGTNMVGLVEVNEAAGAPVAEQPPYHPILATHVRAAQLLTATPAVAKVSDARAQVRVLDSPVPGVATLTAVNRHPDPIEVVISTTVGGRPLRLPEVGQLVLPAGTAMLLAVGYPLAFGSRLLQATVQLLDHGGDLSHLELEVTSPAGGEVVVGVATRPRSVAIAGRPAAQDVIPAPEGGYRSRVQVPAGDQQIVFTLS